MKPLRQSTAVTVRVGPFLDATDGVTRETALTIAAADVLLSKNEGAFAAKNEATAPAHDARGWYTVALNATDTAAAGVLKIDIANAEAAPVWAEFVVLPAQVYDSLVAGTDKLEVDVDQINAVTIAGDGSTTPWGPA